MPGDRRSQPGLAATPAPPSLHSGEGSPLSALRLVRPPHATQKSPAGQAPIAPAIPASRRVPRPKSTPQTGLRLNLLPQGHPFQCTLRPPAAKLALRTLPGIGRPSAAPRSAPIGYAPRRTPVSPRRTGRPLLWPQPPLPGKLLPAHRPTSGLRSEKAVKPYPRPSTAWPPPLGPNPARSYASPGEPSDKPLAGPYSCHLPSSRNLSPGVKSPAQQPTFAP